MRELQRRITAREFQAWQEYYRQEPFGDDWQQAGTVAAAVVNVWAKRPVDPNRFIPREKAVSRKNPKDIEAAMMHWARLHNSVVDSRKKGK